MDQQSSCDSLRKQEMVYAALTKRLEGEIIISMDEEDRTSAEEEYKNALVVKLMMRKTLNKPTLIFILEMLWKTSCKADYMMIASNTLLVKLGNKVDFERVLNGRPWLYVGWAILVSRWLPEKTPNELIPRSLRLWVQIYNMPVEYTAETYSKKAAGAAGKVIKMWKKDKDLLGGLGERFLRFRVDIDVTKPLVPGVYLDRKSGEPIWIMFRYEGLPNCCFKCGLMDHETNSCLLQKSSSDKLGPLLRAEYVDGEGVDGLLPLLVHNRSSKEGQECGESQELLKDQNDCSVPKVQIPKLGDTKGQSVRPVGPVISNAEIKTGDHRCIGHGRIVYTRDQLMQLREISEIPKEIVKAKKQVEDSMLQIREVKAKTSDEVLTKSEMIIKPVYSMIPV